MKVVLPVQGPSVNCDRLTCTGVDETQTETLLERRTKRSLLSSATTSPRKPAPARSYHRQAGAWSSSAQSEARRYTRCCTTLLASAHSGRASGCLDIRT
jgi:hypothetical protein